jgi:hypothetical protein
MRRASAAARRRRALLRARAHEIDCLIDIERLRQIFERAALIRGHCAVEIRMRCHHDDRQLRLTRANLREQLQAAASGMRMSVISTSGRSRRSAAERAVRLIERSRRHAALAQRALEHPADRGIVVDEPDVKRLQ